MKILVAGDWHSDLHEESLTRALESLGHTVVRFAWHRYFKIDGSSWGSKAATILAKVQNRYLFGPLIDRLNRDFVSLVNCERPDVVFVYRGTHIKPSSLQTLKRVNPSITLVGYNNDDPFAPGHIQGLWRHFIGGLPELDLALAYRRSNVEHFYRAGARRVNLLRSWYVPQRNFPLTLKPHQKEIYECDVVFIGHYENDMRLACLEEVARRGWQLKIYGHEEGWTPALKSSKILSDQLPVKSIWGKDYNCAINGARIALCFLSKLNRDSYTRRCFEIPASGTLMLSEYTEDLADLFIPGKEADFFKSPEELVEKIDMYLSDSNMRKKVASAGNNKVRMAGHDVVSRMQEFLGWVEEIRIKNEN